MSIAQKGKTLSEAHKAKLAIAATTRPPISEATRTKLKNRIPNRGMLGRTMSAETKTKMSAARSGRITLDETKAKMRIAAMIREENKRKLKENK